MRQQENESSDKTKEECGIVKYCAIYLGTRV
jgi:hypothetical protein